MAFHGATFNVMNSHSNEGSALLKPEEAGEQLRVSKSTVYRLIASGELKTVGVGARNATRIPRSEVAAYIDRNRRAEVA